MASAVLHIKDSYYFDVPKALWRAEYRSKEQFPEVWVRLDPDYQLYEAERVHSELAKIANDLPPFAEWSHEYEHWKHDHAHAGKPYHLFLAEGAPHDWIKARTEKDATFPANVERVVRTVRSQAYSDYIADANRVWDSRKISSYNTHLSGKIVLPQPFGQLRNLYEKESGVCISRFMVVEMAVALMLCLLFSWLAKRVVAGDAPRGRLWNLLEVFVVFLRDQIARPAIDSHEDHHGHAGHDEHHGHGHDDHEHHGHGHAVHHAPVHEGDRFVPLLCTIFFFVLGCNLSGMVPWIGAPTGSFGVTFGLACVTFATVIVAGMLRFGPIGFFLNQVPGMDLPLVLAIFIKPMIFAIEILGLCIKHAVLSVRLLANMVAGHLVLLAILGMAFSLEGATSSLWPVTAFISVVGSTLLSLLELFVAFLQAYIFAFLSALFIGAAIHHH